MANRRALTEEESIRAVALSEEGFSQRHIAQRLQRSQSVVSRVLNRHRQTGGHTRRVGQGRPRSTSHRDERFLQLHALRDRRSTGNSLRGLLQRFRNVQISERTVRRRLNDYGLTSHPSATGPLLSREHRVERLRFAREHLNWTQEDWSLVLFSDESRFCLRSPDGREKVWRRRGERYAPCTFSPRVAFGGGSVMVWGGINLNSRTELVLVNRGSITADRYIREVLEPHVIPFARNIAGNFIFMHDNARPHVARSVQNFLRQEEIDVMVWPPRSPDMNPIEHVWDMLGRRVRARDPQNLADLREMLVEEWNNM